MVRKYSPLSLSTSYGHLDTLRQGIASTRKPLPSPSVLSAVNSLAPTLSRLDRRRQLFLDDSDDQDGEMLEPPSSLAETSASTRRSTRLTSPPLASSQVRTVHRSEWTASDLTGRFPVPSYKGHEYLLITLHLGYIHYLPIKTRSASYYISAFKKIFAFFTAKSFPIAHLILENESSTSLTTFLQSQHVSFQHVPPNQHRTNPAERAIRTAKNHLLSVLSAAHISFPPNRWPALLPLTELTLNHLRSFAPDPSISAWHGFHGQPLDFAAHPIHPAGQLVVSHDPPLQRASWAKHGTRGFYLSPALTHYRSHLVFIPSTLDTRITNQLDFFPDPLFTFEDPTLSSPPPDPTSSRPSPTLDGSDLIGQMFVDPELGLCRITGHGQPAFLQPNTGNLAPGQRLSPGWHPTLSYISPTGAVEHLTVTEVARWIQDHPPPPSSSTIVVIPPCPASFVLEPLVIPTRTLRPRRRDQPASSTPATAPPPPLPSRRLRGHPSSAPMLFASDTFTPRRSPRFTAMRCAAIPVASAGGLPPPQCVSQSDPLVILAVPPDTVFTPHRRLPSAGALAVAASPATYPRAPLPAPAPQTPTWFPSAAPELPTVSSRYAPVLNLDELGRPLTFRSALAGPYGDQWRRANGNELVKLVETARALTPVHTATSLPMYLHNVVKEKWFPPALLRPGHLRDIVSDVDRRVRGTAGGDRLSVSYPVSTAVASNPLVNCLFNATVSEDAYFGTVDLTDFYLGTPNPNPPFLKVFLDQYPPEVLSRLHLAPFTETDRRTGRPYCIFRADQTIYGLKEAGKLSNERLVRLLAYWGFVETSTPCLFRHPTRSIAFVLVVDDFGIKYHSRDDYDYLVKCLPPHSHQIFRIHPQTRPPPSHLCSLLTRLRRRLTHPPSP